MSSGSRRVTGGVHAGAVWVIHIGAAGMPPTFHHRLLAYERYPWYVLVLAGSSVSHMKGREAIP